MPWYWGLLGWPGLLSPTRVQSLGKKDDCRLFPICLDPSALALVAMVFVIGQLVESEADPVCSVIKSDCILCCHFALMAGGQLVIYWCCWRYQWPPCCWFFKARVRCLPGNRCLQCRGLIAIKPSIKSCECNDGAVAARSFIRS